MRLSIAATVACIIAGAAFAQTSQATADNLTNKGVGAGVRAQTVSISPQSLSTALKAFAEQSKLYLIYAQSDVINHRTAGATGELTADETLKRLLKDTGLVYRMLDDNTITIVPVSSKTTAGSLGKTNLRLSQNSDSSDKSGMKPVASEGENAASANADNAKNNSLQEVVVTAQRREQNLIDVPISISAFTDKEMDTSSEVSVNDMLFSVPGVNVTTNTIGGVSKISIRGVNSLLGSNTVGYYVDGVPFGFVVTDFSPDPGTFDLDRVEVLRGPQGTLYGANSLNGVVRVLTKDADLDHFEIKGRTLISSIEGGGENFGADAVVNLPIVSGKLAARLMLSYDHKAGYVDNFVADEINDGNINNIRLKINGQPSDELSVKLGYWRSRSQLGSLPMSYPDRDFYPGELNPGKVDRFDVYSGTVDYDFGSFTASNTTSYVDYLNQSIVDWSAFTLTNELPIDGLFYYTQTSKVFSNEFTLNSTSDGPWAWTAGAIYRDAKDLTTYRSIFGIGVPSQDESTSSALFGELTRYFADGALELTGGLRYFHDKVHQFEPGGTYALTSTFDHISPRAVLAWHPRDDMTVYASYAQGFRSGLNQPAATEAAVPGLPPAREDTLDNYEIGSKGNLFNRFLSYEVAAYYINWSDVKQVLCTEVVKDGVPDCQGLFVNTGTAKGSGVDVALTFRPIENLIIGLSGSWNDLHFTDDVFFGPDLLYSKGDRLTSSAEYTLGGSISYRVPLGHGGLEGGISGSVNHKSAVDLVDVPGRATGDAITDSRLGLQIMRPEGWTFEIFSDNVLNERGVAIPNNPGTPWGSYYATRFSPRTIGAQFSFQFR